MIPITNGVFNDAPGTIEDDCESKYVMEEGLRVIPVMGPAGTPPTVVRVHAAFTMRMSKFKYKRSKTPPAIPAPGNTLGGHNYLGGELSVPAPTQDSTGNIVYSLSGNYSFVLPTDLREVGAIEFDKHSHRSLVDFLGYYYLNPDPKVNDTWNFPYLDLDLLASNRILG